MSEVANLNNKRSLGKKYCLIAFLSFLDFQIYIIFILLDLYIEKYSDSEYSARSRAFVYHEKGFFQKRSATRKKKSIKVHVHVTKQRRAKSMEEIINKNIMVYFNVNPLLMLSSIYFEVVQYMPLPKLIFIGGMLFKWKLLSGEAAIAFKIPLLQTGIGI